MIPRKCNDVKQFFYAMTTLNDTKLKHDVEFFYYYLKPEDRLC
ncbi:hypothetical protein T01_2264 [Trichinella spiralis]|uniref:Uncharacterized protein n=1 Tax=Trichinella spiralis TaxID=6334 RepID=A0A0V0Z0D4_TRISP|nr:hypothetical protein T01_2264 [Trichinella spiralis]